MHRFRASTSIAFPAVAAAVLIALTLLEAPGGRAQASSSTPSPGPTPAPANVYAGQVTAHSIAVWWTLAALPKITSFRVVLTNWATPALYNEIVILPGDPRFYSRSATFTNLPVGTTYQAQVRTCDGNGVCFPSVPIMVTTLAAPGATGCTLHGPPPICQ